MKASTMMKAVAALACAATLAANAATVTYTQVGEQPVSNISLDGIPSSAEITATPQLAFPGVTLDDIHGCTFKTELFGGTGDGYANTVTTRATAWGIHPHKHRTNGSIDKMYMAFGVLEKDSGDGNTYSKFVVLVLNNGEGGVYVQKFGTCHYKKGNNEWCMGVDCAKSPDSSGNPRFTTDGDKPLGSSSENGGTYKAWGLYIHGFKPVPQARLAFPGMTLAELVNCSFVAGHHGAGASIDYTTINEAAEDVKYLPSADAPEKIVMQFRQTDQNRGAIIMLTEGADGVYATHTHHKNGASATFTLVEDASAACGYTVSGYTVATYSTNGTQEGSNYGIDELYAVANGVFVPSDAPMLLWTRKGGTLTLNDLAGASFAACMAGSAVYPAGKDFKNLYVENMIAQNPSVGLNTRETIDANGDITEIVTEFQYIDPKNNGKRCVVVKFTNGEGGVYGQALAARYGLEYGYVYYGGNGVYYGSGSSIATGRSDTTFNGAYGVFSLRATANAAKLYRQGTTYTFGVIDEATPSNGTMVPYSAATPLIGGVTLEELSGLTFMAFHTGTINVPQYRIGKFPTLYTANDGNEKLLMQFTSFDDNWYKNAFLQLAINANGTVTVQKNRRKHTRSGSNRTQYFKINDDGTVDYSILPGNGGNGTGGGYDLYGLRICPGFVQTEPTLLFKNATLSDLEEGEFSARAGGPSMVPIPSGRVAGYNKRVVKDGDGVSHILVEFQAVSGDYIKAVIVEFTNGEGGVYGVAKEARYIGVANGLGYEFVTSYDGTAITYQGNDSNPATSDIAGDYGVFDVQAEVIAATEWVLDQDRSWSEFTGGEPIDDAAAVIRIKVTGENPVLTIDENATVGQVVFANETGAAASTNAVVIGSGAFASIGSVKLGAGAQVALPPALASAEAVLESGAKLVYTGPAAVSQVVSGAGSVEVASGSVTFQAANTFAGGLVVSSGAIVVAGFEPGRGSAGGPFGAIDGAVTVEAGGMVDINGKNGLSYRYTLAGNGVGDKGPIVNQGGALAIGSTDWAHEWTTGHARKFTLASDVTLGAAGNDFGVVASSRWELPEYECWLDLGDLGNETGYTLTKTGTGTLWLWASQLSATGHGTLSIQQGTVDIRKGRYVGASSAIAIGADGTLRLGSKVEAASIANDGLIQIVPWYYGHNYSGATLTGAYSGSGKVEVLSGGRLNVGSGLSVADFENKGTVEGSGALTVTGTLTPGAAIPNLTLAGGSTIRMTGTDKVQTVTGTFAATGKVKVDGSAISDEDLKAVGWIPVISAPSIPEDVKRRFSAAGASNRTFRMVTEDGTSTIYMGLSHGFTLIVR